VTVPTRKPGYTRYASGDDPQCMSKVLKELKELGAD
jgi:hypothetical protein